MFTMQRNGVLKKIETWSVMIPRHDNDGKQFGEELLSSIYEHISLNFPGFSLVNCTGYWKDSERLYIDENIQIVVDTIPDATGRPSEFFAQLKSLLQKKLNQEKIYITKQVSKEELISFDELFADMGLESVEAESISAKRDKAEQLVSQQDFAMSRLSYETVSLTRNFLDKTIAWERKLCGITLNSEFPDVYPAEAILVAADCFDR